MKLIPIETITRIDLPNDDDLKDNLISEDIQFDIDLAVYYPISVFHNDLVFRVIKEIP